MLRHKIHVQIMALLGGASDQLRSEAVDMHDIWEIGKSYTVGDVVRHDCKLYRCLLGHESQETWIPDVSPSLWAKIMYRDGIRIIPEVIEATQAFSLGEIGWWGDEKYRSLLAANVYTPEQYPAGWEMVG